jgi:predicted HTH transcriptional regulator
MANLQSDIQRLVDGFVAQITELARRAAVEGLEQALARSGSKGGGGAVRLGRGRGRGAKRTANELSKMQSDFLAFVAKNPGLRIEQINKQLGTTTKDLALPIRKLIADGSLKAKGKKRSTTYFAGGRAKN